MSDDSRQPLTFADQVAALGGTNGSRVEPMNVPNREERENTAVSYQLSEVIKQVQNSLAEANSYFMRVLEERVETLETLIYEPFKFNLNTAVATFEYDLQPQTQQVVLIDTVMAWFAPPDPTQVTALIELPNTPPNFALRLPMFNGVDMTLPLTGITAAGAQFWSCLYSPTKIILDGRLRKLYGSMTTGDFPAGSINGMLCGKAVPATLGGKLG